MISTGFHPEALLEYAEAADYDLSEASPGVAEAFMTEVHTAPSNRFVDYAVMPCRREPGY